MLTHRRALKSPHGGDNPFVPVQISAPHSINLCSFCHCYNSQIVSILAAILSMMLGGISVLIVCYFNYGHEGSVLSHTHDGVTSPRPADIGYCNVNGSVFHDNIMNERFELATFNGHKLEQIVIVARHAPRDSTMKPDMRNCLRVLYVSFCMFFFF